MLTRYSDHYSQRSMLLWPSCPKWLLVIAIGLTGLTLGCTDSNDHSTDHSTDYSLRHEVIQSPAGTDSGEPHLALGPNGTVVLSWIESNEQKSALRFASFNNGSWGPAGTIARGDNWFVNWADFPSVTPISDTLWAAHWLVKRPGGTYAYDVAIAVSNDAGQTWGNPITPHDDDTPTEHGFVSLYPSHSGIGAVWLDGRNMNSAGHDEHGKEHDEGHAATIAAENNDTDEHLGGMTLRSAVLSPQGMVKQPRIIDALVCDCCQTDVAMGRLGPLAVYRNRTTDEVRDIYLSREIDGEWQEGFAVASDGWKIAGCPVNGPAIATDDARVAVAWFTAADNIARVRLAMSSNDGESFSNAINIDDDQPLGRVDVEWLEDGNAAVSWLRQAEDNQSELCVKIVSASGESGPTHVLMKMSSARSTGFPQMVRNSDELLFAWTDISGSTSVVKTMRVVNALKQ